MVLKTAWNTGTAVAGGAEAAVEIVVVGYAWLDGMDLRFQGLNLAVHCQE